MTKKKDFYLPPFPLLSLKEEESGEFVQLIPPALNEEGETDKTRIELPILPVKNTVLFPGVVIPITVSRKKSIKRTQRTGRSWLNCVVKVNFQKTPG